MGISANLSLRVDLSSPEAGRIGPGKIALLEAVREHRSISAAARQLDMSYRRAWLLLDALNQSFKSPVVITATGGKRGGGAELSPVGEQIVRHYRDLETAAHAAANPHLKALQQLAGRQAPGRT
jgi:molybdate transport system regulatory protein